MSKNALSRKWNFQDHELPLDQHALIMGILNTTPDSFSDGGEFQNIKQGLAQAHQMISDGAQIIDIGGESTRPGADSVPAEEEIRRTAPLIKALRKEWRGLISIDTSKATVAQAAMDAGANIINDVTALEGDPQMPTIAKEYSAGLILMHMKGSPKTMQNNPCYDNLTADLKSYFSQRLEDLHDFGISTDSIALDPGIGFGKTLEHNLHILKNLSSLQIETRPLAIGLSRKSFIAQAIHSPALTDPMARDALTATLTALTRQQGAVIHRVHNVQLCQNALRMAEALL